MANLGFIVWLIGLSVMTFFAVAWLLDISNRQRQLQQRLDQTFTDAEGRDLSQPLAALTARLDANEEQTQQLGTEVERLKGHSAQAVQAVSLVRFQAFSDYGGDQSFAMVLATTAGDGVILSGIFAREGTRVYAKPLASWTSSYSLSLEEEEAIGQAQSQIQ